jgi:hypothetical protein
MYRFKIVLPHALANDHLRNLNLAQASPNKSKWKTGIIRYGSSGRGMGRRRGLPLVVFEITMTKQSHMSSLFHPAGCAISPSLQIKMSIES